ncbi:MAG: energy transducer TonB [Proteobacteria bacterium]|nr:MAG: energy transducer TonB [Pseudomonadota bacterium]
MKEEIARKIQRYAKKPRTKYVSSSTKAYEYAPYINQWVKTIERTGDLNYPDKAKKKSFKGEVMLTVGINKDGSLHEIKIIKPSKYRFLDEAAKHIVEIAQPFEPLPDTQEPVDILYITRTWQFLPGHLLRQK